MTEADAPGLCARPAMRTVGVLCVWALVLASAGRARDADSAGSTSCSLKDAECSRGKPHSRAALLSSGHSPVFLQLKAEGTHRPATEGSMAADTAASVKTCMDDPTWKDPLWKATCADWRGYSCSSTDFGEELRNACPLTCGVCNLSFAQPSSASPEAPSHASVIGNLCFDYGECCPGHASRCSFFCKEGSEIDKQSIKGWRVKGACREKWQNFCMEDEDCSFGQYCKRRHRRQGTCTEETGCSTRTCRRGHCRAGKCTCEFGFTGEFCHISTQAFAFLFYGNSTENLVSTRVLIESLRAAGSAQDVVAIIPANLADTVPPESLKVLTGDGVKLHYSEPIAMPESMDIDPVIHQRWSGVMNKFAAWRLTNYTQVALVDTDMIFSLHSENPGNMFQECRADLCAVQDGDARFLNAGLMIVSPSSQRLSHILHVLHNEQHHFDMPEQSFLTEYCKEQTNRMTLQFLDKKWNSCVGGGMLENIGWEGTGYNLLHSCSWQGKPPTMEVCYPDSCDPMKQLHTVLTWQHFHMQSDSCIRQRSEEDCNDMGIKSCHWCGHYCSRNDIECSAKMFGRPRAAPGKQAFAGEDDWHASYETAAWEDLPQGFWAWPQVAMYQILIDRFASPQAAQCDRLDDYCGGTFRGIAGKLEYLEALGVDGIVLSPVVEQMPHGYHGYWTKNLDAVNPQYGSADELRMLVMKAQQTMKVIVDVNLNHAGSAEINASRAGDVSRLQPFNKTEYFHQSNCSLMHNEDYERGAFSLEHCALYGLPDYNHEHPFVWQRLHRWLREHVDEYGFDGVRVDAARHISPEFLRSFPATGAPIPAFREVVDGDLTYVASFATGEYDAVYNYPLYFTLRSIFGSGHVREDMSKLGTWMAREAPKARGKLLLNFLDNNDLPRFIDKVEGNEKLYRNALLCIAGMEGLPILLYGSEQNARGRLNESDALKVDNWRPPQWHFGYNTSVPTFRTIKKILWLRRQQKGMHSMRQEPVYSDHSVLMFRRGPFMFVVTNEAKDNQRSQRVVWHNATEGMSNGSKLCDLLAEDPLEHCIVVALGNLTRYHIAGEPQLYIPTSLARMYLKAQSEEEEKEEQRQKRRHSGKKDSFVASSLAQWPDMPRGPQVRVQGLERTPRAQRPLDVDYGEVLLPAVGRLPIQKDLWYPPVGVKAHRLVTATLEDSCFALSADSEDSGLIYAERDTETYFICQTTLHDCEASHNLTRMRHTIRQMNVSMVRTPVFHATVRVWSGVYHMLVTAVPSLMPHLAELQKGSMKVFFHSRRALVLPILNMLDVSSAAFFPPRELPLQESYGFCTGQMVFNSRTDQTQDFVAEHLHQFRLVLRKTHVLMAGPTSRKIVILSRGNCSRSLSNEGEMADALQTFGLPVEVVHPSAEQFAHTVDALNQAAVVVGAHGANLANIAFAPIGVGVVEVVPQAPFTFVNHHFRTLAGALGLRYVPVGAPIQDFDEAKALDTMLMDKAIDSYAVDVAKIVAAVESLL